MTQPNRLSDTEPWPPEPALHKIYYRFHIAQAVTELSQVAELGDAFHQSDLAFGD